MLRQATRDDKTQIVSLLKQISEQHAKMASDKYQVTTDEFSLSYVERCLTSEKSIMLVIEKNNRIVGVAICIIQEINPDGPVKDSLIGNLDTIVVDTNFQGKGFGRQLLSAIESWAKKNGCTRMKLNVAVENTQGIDFYLHRGYTRSDIRFTKKI